MTDNGDDIARPQHASRLADLAEASVPVESPAPAVEAPVSAPDSTPVDAGSDEPVAAEPVDELVVARRGFARLLGEFRRSAVLVPFDARGSLWTADFNGVRWICAFSDEVALARFAVAQGDAVRELAYRTVLGARLLDVMVPMLPGPGGVALDAGSDEGMVFPPVAGIVPDAVAVDFGGTR
ncbi:SseB family protein [Streptomyces sp. NPDC015127]|uniref:SseB family protein n=1 Tax=Streptomyces sp. NPDC015127 TaxID=3364939 RepID=UPI0036FF89FB